MIKSVTFSLLFFLMNPVCIKAEQLYVNPMTGNDMNAGVKTQPLRSLSEAAKQVNLDKDREETTIILTEGVHLITETFLFTNGKLLYHPC